MRTSQTIGVAVSIPEPWASKLQDYRRAVGDATASMIPTHITIIPPTQIAAEVLADVEAHLADVASHVEPFTVHLRGTGTFRPVSDVVFVAVIEGISQCEQLALACRRGPLDVELAFPYHPHVTIAHDLDQHALDRAFADLSEFECVFTVDVFHLYAHDEESGWRPTHDFRLRSSVSR